MSDGHTDRASLSGLRPDKGDGISDDGEGWTICPNASDGDSDCVLFTLFSMEPLYQGKKGEGNECAYRDYNGSSGVLLCPEDVSLFPGQDSLCVYGAECLCKNFSIL